MNLFKIYFILKHAVFFNFAVNNINNSTNIIKPRHIIIIFFTKFYGFDLMLEYIRTIQVYKKLFCCLLFFKKLIFL